MSEMFHGCSSLKYLNVYNFDTKNVTNMCEMFQELQKFNKFKC